MLERLSSIYQNRKWEIILLCLIISIGIFFRTYNFSDWLLFEVDQTYDTRIVSQAIENGIENLPLLGPTAGGGRALRLGPAFYYMEYASALVFGDTPTGHAMLVLIFSILSLPLFYLFSRRYFSIPLSLSLLAIFSGSVFLVLYGRFSWSPNVLPFLILLSFYALLRSVSRSETEIKRNRFFLLSVAAIALASQIHFNSFFTIPTIAVILLLYKRPKFPIKTWLMAFMIIALVYSPMVLSDISTSGENVNLFLKKISKGGSVPFEDAVRKSIVTIQYNASGYFFVTTGIDRISGKRIKDYGFQNDANLPWRSLALVLIIAELCLIVLAMRRERDADRRDFLILIFLWASVPFAYFYSLISGNFHFYPRFYLLIAPVAVIFFGFLLQMLHPERHAARRAILAGITLMILVPNITRIFDHFLSLANPERDAISVEREDIFPNDKRLTLNEQIAITEFMLDKQRKNGYPIYIATYSEYEPVFWYHLGRQGLFYSDRVNESHLYAEGNYFLIQYPDAKIRATKEDFIIEDKEKFGALAVYTMTPQETSIDELRQPTKDYKEFLQTSQIRDLTTWKTFFSSQK